MAIKIILSLYNENYTFIESYELRYKERLSKCVSLENKSRKLTDYSTFSLIKSNGKRFYDVFY